MTNTDPVTVAPDADPIPVLQTMAKFLPGDDRGLAEIRAGNRVIGLAALIGHPEKAALPLFDAATRVVAVLDLGTWLQERGFEASACWWERSPPALTWSPVKWLLCTGEAKVPELPPDPVYPANMGGLGEPAGAQINLSLNTFGGTVRWTATPAVGGPGPSFSHLTLLNTAAVSQRHAQAVGAIDEPANPLQPKRKSWFQRAMGAAKEK